MPMTSWTAPRARRYEAVSAGREDNRGSEAKTDSLDSSTRTS